MSGQYEMPDWYDNWKLSNGPHGDECDCENCNEPEQLEFDLGYEKE